MTWVAEGEGGGGGGGKGEGHAEEQRGRFGEGREETRKVSRASPPSLSTNPIPHTSLCIHWTTVE